MAILECIAALFLESPCCIDADRQALSIVLATSKIFDVFEIAKSPGKEICAHYRGLFKRNDLPAALACGARFFLWHVAKSDLIVGHLN